MTEPTLAAWDADRFAWPDVAFTPPSDEAWVETDYVPGPMSRATLATNGELEVLPMYVIRVSGPTNAGGAVLENLADALLEHFAPGSAITNSQSEVLRVRGDVAPFAGQLLRTDTMQSTITVTVPLRLRTTN